MAPNGSQRLPTAPYDYKHTLLLFSSSMTPTDFHLLPPRELTPQPYSKAITDANPTNKKWPHLVAQGDGGASMAASETDGEDEGVRALIIMINIITISIVIIVSIMKYTPRKMDIRNMT